MIFPSFSSIQTTGIRVIGLYLPSQVIIYSDVQLFCDVDLENDTLYSLKWYLNQSEVVSFTPTKNHNRIQYYSNIFQDVNHLQNHATLDNKTDQDSRVNTVLTFDPLVWKELLVHSVSWRSEGVWSCEVFADVTFQRDRREETVTIIGWFPFCGYNRFFISAYTLHMLVPPKKKSNLLQE